MAIRHDAIGPPTYADGIRRHDMRRASAQSTNVDLASTLVTARLFSYGACALFAVRMTIGGAGSCRGSINCGKVGLRPLGRFEYSRFPRTMSRSVNIDVPLQVARVNGAMLLVAG